MKKECPLILLLWCLAFSLSAQKYEWVKFYQGQQTQQLSSLSSDDDGNVYFTINFNPEIKFDTTTIQGSSPYRTFISKRNTSGNTLWYKVARSLNNGNNMFSLGSTFTNSGNQLVFIMSAADMVLGADTIRRTNSSGYTLYILEINPSGKLVRGRELLYGSFPNLSYLTKNFTHDANDNIYISLQCNGPVTVFDTTATTVVGSSSGNYIFKFSNAGRVLQWGRTLPSNIITNNIDTDIHGNVYIGSYWENSPSSFTFNNQTINRPQTTSGCAFILDKNGKDKNWINIVASGGESTVAAIAAHDSNSVYVTGYFKGDSAKFENTWKKAKVFGAYHFFARYTTGGKLLWEKHEDTTMTSNYQKHSDYASIANFKDQYLYISHFTNTFAGPIYYDRQKYMAPNINWGMNLKVDEYGNILWGFRTFYPFSAMGTDLQNNLYFGGWFENDSVFFGPFKAKGNAGDAFVGKTFDYAIFRGKVTAGPYCAGDTFRIPFTKLGTFADTNTFFAELSDEYGNFSGKERVLGKLKTKDSGTILGILPMFKVASSQKYRIRIRSTSPQAQSFYKIDTLRLLIYSRDKADPGKDETICRGDTITLKTFGGTKWAWSPRYKMLDSAVHETLAWPDKTTKYKIIISDSSGCGQADTSYKTIVVRKDPKISFQTLKDTTACIGSKFQVIANYSFGDSAHYHSLWYSISKTGVFTVLKEGYVGASDTLNYNMPKTVKDSQRLILFLTDDCSPKTDFAYFTIHVNQERPDAIMKTRDTSLCPGASLAVLSGFSKGFIPGYNWKWMEKELNGNWQTIISGSNKREDTLSYIFPLNWNKNKKKILAVALNDACSPFADTAILTITQRDTITLALNAYDKTLCRGQKFVWKATGNGGYSPGYHYIWKNADNSQILSLSDSFVFVADTTTKVNLVLTDSCMPKSISTGFLITVHPALVIGLKTKGGFNADDTTLCYGQQIAFFGEAKGGKGSGYGYNWKINNQLYSMVDSAHFNSMKMVTNQGGQLKLVLSVTDNCTIPEDSASLMITVLPALSAVTKFSDSICFGQEEIFKAWGIGGNGNYSYKWYDAANGFLGASDSLIVNNKNSLISGPTKRWVVISDACTLLNDTIMMTSELLKPLTLKLTTSDSCPLLTCNLNPLSEGGKGYGYKIDWWQDYVPIGTTGNISKTVAPKSSRTIFKAVLWGGCGNPSDTSMIKIGLKPVVHLSATGQCLGDTTNILARSSFPGKFNWKMDHQGIAGSDSFQKIMLASAGIYQFNVATVGNDCNTEDSITVNILKKPVADFTFMRLKDNGNGIPFHFSDASANANTWHWKFGTMGNSNARNPDFNFTDTGRIRIKLKVSNTNICFDSIERVIPVYQKFVFYFPNAFSPNANGINDGFGLDPGQYPYVKSFRMEVYNRWGEKIFETDDVGEHWMPNIPSDKLKIQQGVYLFKAIIIDLNDESIELSGAVELLK